MTLKQHKYFRHDEEPNTFRNKSIELIYLKMNQLFIYTDQFPQKRLYARIVSMGPTRLPFLRATFEYHRVTLHRLASNGKKGFHRD